MRNFCARSFLCLFLLVVACKPILPDQATYTSNQLETVILSPSLPTGLPELWTEDLSNETVLSICLIDEPETLYLYNTQKSVERFILTAIYDNSINQEYYLQPTILGIDLPTIENRAVQIQRVHVQPGDLLFDPKNRFSTIADAESIENQMVVTFTLNSKATWSDGVPVTASDSVYAFNLHNNTKQTTVGTFTSQYKAVNTHQVRWTGVPNYLPNDYLKQFIPPLPQHVWGQFDLLTLPQTPEVMQKPIGWGPFMIEEWILDHHLILKANPFYTPQPVTKRMVIKFNVEYATAVLPAFTINRMDPSACDLTILHSIETPSLLQEHLALVRSYVYPLAWLHADFVMQDKEGTPTKVAEPKLRQAIGYLLFDNPEGGFRFLTWNGQGSLPMSDKPFDIVEGMQNSYTYDFQRAQELVMQLGWYDEDGDGFLEKTGQKLMLSIGFLADYYPYEWARGMADALNSLGIQVRLTEVTFEEFKQLVSDDSHEQGKPNFDLIIYPSPFQILYECEQFMSSNLFDQTLWLSSDGVFAKTGLANFTKYSNSLYDNACQNAYQSMGLDGRNEFLYQAQNIFVEDLPLLPLVVYPTVAFSRIEVYGFNPMGGVVESWNIEKWGLR